MVPTRLPDLPKLSRTSGESQKPVTSNYNVYKTNKEQILVMLIHPFWGTLLGGICFYRLPYHKPVSEQVVARGGCTEEVLSSLQGP